MAYRKDRVNGMTDDDVALFRRVIKLPSHFGDLSEKVAALIDDRIRAERALDNSAHVRCGYPWAEHICPDTFDNLFETLQRPRENPIPPPPPCDHPERPKGKPICSACWDVYRPEFEAWRAKMKDRAS